MRRFIFNPILVFRGILSIAIALSAGCSSTETTETASTAESLFLTKSGDIGAESRTYRIITYNNLYRCFTASGDGADGSGSYCGIPGEIMRPCRLLADGTVDPSATESDHASSILDGVSGQKRLYCISPGIAPNIDGSFTFCPSENPLYVSDEKSVTVGGVKTIDLGTLIDRRAKIEFEVKVDENNHNIEKIDVEKIILYGTGGSAASYMPASRQVLATHEAIEIEMKDAYGTDNTNNTYPGKKFISDPHIIPSAIYAPKESVAQILKCSSEKLMESQYLYAVFTISQDGRKDLHVAATLNDGINEDGKNCLELSPGRRYKFIFLVSADYVNISVDISKDNNGSTDWSVGNEGQNDDEWTISDDDEIHIDMGNWSFAEEPDNNWDNPFGGDLQVIE